MKRVSDGWMGSVVRWCLVLLVGMGLGAGVGAEEVAKKGRDWTKDDLSPEEQAGSYDRLVEVLKVLSDEGKMEVYEGLPERGSEHYEKEAKGEGVFVDHGYRFYPQARFVTEADVNVLKLTLKAGKSFKRWAGPYACGGFHPDFLVRWEHEGKMVTMQLCFGCHEVRIFSGETWVLCDMGDESRVVLEAVLEDYFWERPDRQAPEEDEEKK